MPRFTSVSLDYLKDKKIKLDVKDVLLHLIMGSRDGGHHSSRIFMCVPIFAFHFFAQLYTCHGSEPPKYPRTQFH